MPKGLSNGTPQSEQKSPTEASDVSSNGKVSRSYLTSVPAFLKRARHGSSSDHGQRLSQTINMAIDEYENRAKDRLNAAFPGPDSTQQALLREALERKRKQTLYKDLLLEQMKLKVGVEEQF